MSFPSEHILPKQETNASKFLSSYPNYNGKNVIIGILDTGVDPGAIGLSSGLPSNNNANGTTSSNDGNKDEDRKIIHVADCTGSGDVRMDKCVDAIWKEGKGWVIPADGGGILFGKDIVLNPKFTLREFPNKKGEKDQDEKEENDTKKDTAEDTKEDNESKETDTEKETTNDENETQIKMPVRIGYKLAYELFPTKLTNRVKAHHARQFNQQQSQHAVEVRTQLSAWEQKYCCTGSNAKKPTQAELNRKKDLEARLEILEGKEGGLLLEDPGPLYQIIEFYDGQDYRVLIDTKEDGDLTSAEGMTDYYKEGQYATFDAVSMCNYAINIYQDGEIVSIVVDAGAHGSHVAGITSAFHPKAEESDANSGKVGEGTHLDVVSGVAPGAKLVSLKIGDTRLGSMETGTALSRALIEAVKHKCDVINLSYGEGCALPNTGRFIKLAEELVHKHGIIFVSSAGNNGPALSSVGAPGGTSEAILGVGAYVSTDMMEAMYSMRTKSDTNSSTNSSTSDDSKTGIDKNNEDQPQATTFTWSSVGPTADGAMGCDIIAPGGAITSVPKWCLQKNQLMNGTSMSSPNATGCIALLLSAAKAEGIKVTPSRLKRAVMNSAKMMDGLSSLQQGWGMIQVDKAWEYIKEYQNDIYEDTNFKVNIISCPGSPRGVYLRQKEESAMKQTFTAHVDPIFGTSDDVSLEIQQNRVEFDMKFILKVESAASSWLSVPAYFMLMHNGRSFKFDVDPTSLSYGVHTTKILAYDSKKPEMGPRFFVPITVVKPLEESAQITLGNLELAPAQVKRHFLSVPSGSQWMDVTIKDCRNADDTKDISARLVGLHTVQLIPHKAYRDAEEKKFFSFKPSQEFVTSIPVHQGITCELTLARYWSTAGFTKINVDVKFRGVTPTPDSIVMLSGGGGASSRLSSDLSNEFVLPNAKLTKWRTPLSPKFEGVISPCDERDIRISENKQIYELVLTYEFEQEDSGSIIPRAPALQGFLYESAYESQLMLVFDSEKRYLGVADAWPDEIEISKPGTVTIRMQIRHDDTKMLEKLRNNSIWIERKLSKDINLSCYSSHERMMVGKSTINKRYLQKGTCMSVFFKEPECSQLPSRVKCGDIVIGSTTFSSGAASLPGAGKKPAGFPFTYVVGESKPEKKDLTAAVPEDSEKQTIEEKTQEAISKLKISQLKDLNDDSDTKFDDYYASLLKEYPEHIPLLNTGLEYYDSKESREEKSEKVISVSNSIIGLIDEKELAAHFGMNHNKEDAKSCKEHKEMEEVKSFLIDALARKARAISDLEAKDDKGGIDDLESFDEVVKHLERWQSIANKKFAILALERERRDKHYGLMLKLLNSLLVKSGDETKGGICPMTKVELLEKRSDVLKILNYDHLSVRDQKWKTISAPSSYALF